MQWSIKGTECPRCGATYEEVEAEGVVERNSVTGLGGQAALNLEATWSQDDSRADPETTVGGQRSGTEGVADCHFPEKNKLVSGSYIPPH